MVSKKKRNKGDAFILDLIKFYGDFLVGTSNAVKTLADIERKYPTEYKILRVSKDNPDLILQLGEKLPETEKYVLFSIMVKSSNLGSRANKLFDLSQKEKLKLVRDMKKFSQEVQRDITKLVGNAR